MNKEIKSDSMALTVRYEYDWWTLGKWRTKYTSDEYYVSSLYATGKKNLVLAVRNDSPFYSTPEFKITDKVSSKITAGYKTGIALEVLKEECSFEVSIGAETEKSITIPVQMVPYSEMSIYTVRYAQDGYYKNVEQLQQHYLKWGVGIGYHDDGAPVITYSTVKYETWNGFEIKGSLLNK